ncbi:MAG TPA: hypothetical protein VFV98_04180 [Vicinamibacterales bacterium]|nr:hypothetical protein [Vicinamibacterales bacterium]
MADDPREHRDVSIVRVQSGFLVGQVDNPSGLAATTNVLILLDDFAEAVRFAQAAAAKAGSRAWLAENESFLRLPES